MKYAHSRSIHSRLTIIGLNEFCHLSRSLNFFIRCSGVDVVMTTSAASGRKGTAKLNELLKMQQVAQERWQRENIFEIDAAEPGSDEAKCVFL